MVELKVENSAPSYSSPERELLVAVLQRAILDYVGTGQLLSSEAGDWLFDEGDGDFSFAWVCGHLGLEPNAVRSNLHRLRLGSKRDKAPLRVLRRCA
ncbi:MAG: hypothetical protein KDD66_09110 [Bdellovibrionales bacterium]|nr:hypothetical protein [Bdellovibrionales bacterium]